jgi:hypothetical protein
MSMPTMAPKPKRPRGKHIPPFRYLGAGGKFDPLTYTMEYCERILQDEPQGCGRLLGYCTKKHLKSASVPHSSVGSTPQLSGCTDQSLSNL